MRAIIDTDKKTIELLSPVTVKELDEFIDRMEYKANEEYTIVSVKHEVQPLQYPQEVRNAKDPLEPIRPKKGNIPEEEDIWIRKSGPKIVPMLNNAPGDPDNI